MQSRKANAKKRTACTLERSRKQRQLHQDRIRKIISVRCAPSCPRKDGSLTKSSSVLVVGIPLSPKRTAVQSKKQELRGEVRRLGEGQAIRLCTDIQFSLCCCVGLRSSPVNPGRRCIKRAYPHSDQRRAWDTAKNLLCEKWCLSTIVHAGRAHHRGVRVSTRGGEDLLHWWLAKDDRCVVGHRTKR